MRAIVVCAALLAGSDGPGSRFGKTEQDLVELLRDSQTTNMNHYRAGKIAGRLVVTYQGRNEATTLDFDGAWTKDKSIWRYRAVDSGPAGDAPATEEGRQADEPTDVHLMIEGGLIYSFGKPNDVIYKRKLTNLPVFLADTFPYPNWFRCCPPGSAGGRPWSELIGVHPAMPQDGVRSLSIRRDGPLVIQERVADGARSVITFDLERGGNVVSLGSTLTRSEGAVSTGTYRWRPGGGGAYLLDSYKFERHSAGRGRRADLTSELTVSKLVLEETPISLARFLAALPPGVKIVDQTGPHGNPKAEAPRASDFERSAASLRAGGFLQRKH